MAKIKTKYKCSNCGYEASKWMGQCPKCKEYSTFEEFTPVEEVKGAVAKQGYGYAGINDTGWKSLDEITGQEEGERYDTGMSELNRVLGGGLVSGSTILLAGSPGAGKSTILLQAGCNLAKKYNVGVVSGEESRSQIKGRAVRLGLPLDNLKISTQTDVKSIGHDIEKYNFDVLIADSIASLYHPQVESAPGSASQLKTCTVFLNIMAKTHNCAIIMIGHITKGDEVAGPKALEHVVDAVLDFFPTDDTRYRMLRAGKNRFGSTSEVGIFEMKQDGLQGVDNPSAIFLNRVMDNATGSVATPLWEGTRPLLIEVQVLMDKSTAGNPRRVAVGVDDKRTAMLIAILNRHSGIQAYDYDVYVNMAGGIKVTDTSADLSIIMAAASSFLNRVIPPDVMAFGEVGLSGEIKPVANGEERLKEASRLGFKTAFVPSGNWKGMDKIGDMEVIPLVSISQAVDEMKTFEIGNDRRPE